MSCRRKAASSNSAPEQSQVKAADVDDRELSAAAQERVVKKNARAPDTNAQPFPLVPFIVVLVVLVGVGLLTIKYS